jgi:hypothetical protein
MENILLFYKSWKTDIRKFSQPGYWSKNNFGTQQKNIALKTNIQIQCRTNRLLDTSKIKAEYNLKFEIDDIDFTLNEFEQRFRTVSNVVK